MPRITDDDDVNLDDIDTESPEENDSEGADETEQDTTDEHAPDDSESEADEETERDSPDDVAARSRQPERQEGRRERERTERVTGRAGERIRTLNEDLRREREERVALQRRFDEFAARQQNPPQPRESEDQRNQRRALLSDSERAAEDIRESEARINARLNQTTFTIQDNADRSVYEAKTVNNASYRRMQADVETEHARLAAAGQFVSRQAIYYYLLGKKIDEARGSKANETRRAQGGRRVERQSVRPGDTRNDTQQTRRGGTKSLEDRLADVPL